jgi:microcystin-dependent protein
LPSRILGETGGAEQVTLTTQQIPTHTHPAGCQVGANANQSVGNAAAPGNGMWAQQASTVIYSSPPPGATPMNAGAVGIVGGSQPHDNMIPYLPINFIISLFGLFPHS